MSAANDGRNHVQPEHPGALVIGIDVGGTKILAGVVDGRGQVIAEARHDTPSRRSEDAVLERALDAVVSQLRDRHPVAAIGVAAAGFVSADGASVRFAPHLSWRDAPVRARLQERWSLPVALENDATAATHAEATFGAARDADTALLVTLGTGIGGGLVVGGRVVRGRNGMAGEFGHMTLVPNGVACECGGRGCWEQYASGNALERFAREGMGLRPSLLTELCDGDPEALTGPMVTDAAEQGDLVALDAFARMGDWVGIGLANLVAAFDPEVVVVGGGVASAGERLLQPARTALTRSLVGVGHREVPPVLRAALGAHAGLLGAADLARHLV